MLTILEVNISGFQYIRFMDKDWENTEIEEIRKKMDSFLSGKNIEFLYSIKNSRDGGYVLYSNKKRTIEVYVFFLPDYDLEIHYRRSLMECILTFFAKNQLKNYYSLRRDFLEAVGIGRNSFLDKSMKIIIEEKLLDKK